MRPVLLALAVLLAWGVTATAAERPETLEIDRFLRRHLDEIPTPGFSVVVVSGDEIVFARGYGVERVGEETPLTARSPIGIGSQTKSFTAVAVMQLVERGLLALDEPVTTYLPWFRTADGRGDEITVRMLLTNTSGIPSRDRWLFSRDTSEDAIEKGVRSLSSVPLVRAPGRSFEYANENWNLLGLLISEVTGMPYSAYLQEHVLDPLDMTQSTTALARFQPLGVLYGHAAGIDGVHPAEPRFLAESLPAGSELRASAEDMGHYLVMLLAGGQFRGRRILREESVETLFVPASHFRADMPDMGAIGIETGYGMGWAITEADGRTLVHHGGDAIVMGSWTVLDLEQRLGASVLYNGPILDPYRYRSRVWLANNLLHLVRGEPVSDFGVPVEADPTANDYELPPEQLDRYVGSYLSADGLRARIAREGDRLTLHMRAGDLVFRYEVDFLSPSSAALRNVSGAALTRFLMTPELKVTGLEGGLLGGVYRKRRAVEGIGRRQVRSPDGRFVCAIPATWQLRWDGARFEARDPESPQTVLRGGIVDPTAAGGRASRELALAPSAARERRSETISGLLWDQLIWSDEAGGRQGMRATTVASGTTFELALTTPRGDLTATVRDVLVPLMNDLELRGSL